MKEGGEERGATEYESTDFKIGGWNTCCMLVSGAEQNFMQNLSPFLMFFFFGDKKEWFALLQFRINEKIHTKVVVVVVTQMGELEVEIELRRDL